VYNNKVVKLEGRAWLGAINCSCG